MKETMEVEEKNERMVTRQHNTGQDNATQHKTTKDNTRKLDTSQDNSKQYKTRRKRARQEPPVSKVSPSTTVSALPQIVESKLPMLTVKERLNFL